MKKPTIWWPLAIAVTMIIGMFTGYSLSKKIPASQGFWNTARKTSVQEVIDLLEKKYVDPLSTDSLSERAILSLLEKLDPHTVYLPPVHAAMAEQELKGHFDGIGIEYFLINDTVHAARILPGSPSEKAGLQMGDKLLKVDEMVVVGPTITKEKITRLLRGESGTQVRVELLRDSKKQTVMITRGSIVRPAVDAAYLIEQGTGFVHLNKFSQQSYEEVMAAMEKLQQQGMKKLILDLRGNSGGMLDEAIDMADEFLEGNRLVLYTEGAHSPRTDYTCKRPGLFEKGDLYLLVDESSASASEVLAGALQDWDRGILIGRRTFGKGLVQEPFQLTNGAQLRLTVSRFYTPSGRNIQKSFGSNNQDYANEVFDRIQQNGTSSPAFPDSTAKPYTTLLKKRTVYGGGGITPDWIIPFDSISLPHPFDQVFGLEHINQTMYQFLMEEHLKAAQFKDANDFASHFSITPSLVLSLESFLKKQGMDMSALSMSQRKWIEKRMKAVIALHLFPSGDFYKVTHPDDQFIQKALALARGK